MWGSCQWRERHELHFSLGICPCWPSNPNTVLYTPVRTVMVRPKRKIILSSRRNRLPSKPSHYHIMATKSEMLRPFPVFFSKLPKPSSLPLPPQTTFQKMWFVYNILTNSVLNSLCERHSQTKPAKWRFFYSLRIKNQLWSPAASHRHQAWAARAVAPPKWVLSGPALSLNKSFRGWISKLSTDKQDTNNCP